MKLYYFIAISISFAACSVIHSVKQLKANLEQNMTQSLAASGNSLAIPFEYNENKRILIKLKSGKTGKVYDFIYDTGASATVFENSALCSDLEFVQYEHQVAQGGYGGESISSGYYTGDVEVAGVIFASMRFDKSKGIYSNASIDCPEAEQESAVSGIVGPDFFHQHFVMIDFEASYIRLSSSAPDDISSYSIQLKGETYTRYGFECTIGGIKRDILLDTGDPGGMHVMDDLVKANEYLSPGYSQIETSLKMGLGESLKSSVSYKGYAKQVVVEGLPPIDSLASSMTSVEYKGLSIRTCTVGNDFLNNFNILIDTEKSIIYLKPLRSSLQFAKAKSISGYRAKVNAEMKTYNIVIIEQTSDAYKNGVRAGHEIISINGKNVRTVLNELDKTEFCEVLNSPAKLKAHCGCDSNCKVEVKLSNGQIIQL